MGAVLSRSFSVLFSNIVPFTLTALAALLPLVAIAIVFTVLMAGFQTGRLDPNFSLSVVVVGIAGSVLLSLVFYPAAGAAIVNATFQYMRDGKARMWSSIKRAFARVFWIILLLLIVFFVLGLIMIAAAGLTAVTGKGPASFLVFIPAFILAVSVALIWFVAIPACVVERLGPIRSLARSQALTAGYRWKLLAIIILTSLVSVGMSIVGELTQLAGLAVYVIVSIILQSVFLAFWFVVPAVVYHDLRVAKEGADIGKIAAIFD